MEHKLTNTWELLTIIGALLLIGGRLAIPREILRVAIESAGAVTLYAGGLFLGIEVTVHHFHLAQWRLNKNEKSVDKHPDS